MQKHKSSIPLRARPILFYQGLLAGCMLFVCSVGFSQNLEKIGTDEMVTVSGGLKLNTIAYASSGTLYKSREPFTWFAGGHINVSILDVSLPFTYTVSNQGGKYTQPFNRTSLNPTYKWIKGQVGLTSMNFSPYTLSGHLFLGAGIELTPGNWKISAMAGRLNKAVEYDVIADNTNSIVYRRFGYGLKCGYEKNGFGGSITLFKARDDVSSLPFVPLNSTVKPQDNLVIGLSAKATVFKNCILDLEYALSALTQNRNDPNDPAIGSGVINTVVSANSTTGFFQAFKAAAKYHLKWMALALNYEHIDPGYQTLGGYYFNNDLNNYTVAPSVALFRKKLNIGANTGFQRNNLSGDKSATTTRWVGSINASFVPGQKLAMSGAYSNFSTFTRNRPVTDPYYYAPADTLNFYQLTRSASLMTVYNMGTADNRSTVQLLYNYQESNSLSGNVDNAGIFGTGVETNLTGVPVQVHAGNLAYSKHVKSVDATVTFAANLNKTIRTGEETVFIGPTANIQKRLFGKKAVVSFGSTYNRQQQAGDLASRVFNHRMAFSFTPRLVMEDRKINFSINANLMQRLAVDPSTPDRHELNVFVNLSYSF